VDAQIRAIDAAAAAAVADEPDDEDDGDQAGWDPSRLFEPSDDTGQVRHLPQVRGYF
jgi:hypothetical protein